MFFAIRCQGKMTVLEISGRNCVYHTSFCTCMEINFSSHLLSSTHADDNEGLEEGELVDDFTASHADDNRLYDSQQSFNHSWSWLGYRNAANESASSREAPRWRSQIGEGSYGLYGPQHNSRLVYNDGEHYGGDVHDRSSDFMGNGRRFERNEPSRHEQESNGHRAFESGRRLGDSFTSMLNEPQPLRASTPMRANNRYPLTPMNQRGQYDGEPIRERESHSSGMKFQRPKPLPEDIPVAEKYERWLDWKTAFDVALSVCGGHQTQMQKVGLLFTSVGPETQRTIRLLGLPPMHNDPNAIGREYEELSRGLNVFFRGMVDEAIDYTRFHEAKQEQGEGIHKFTLRLRGLAVCINIAPSSFGFRHQLLKGMRDRGLAEKASDDNIPLSELIQIAARKEQREPVDTVKKPSSWQTLDTTQPVVAAISGRKREKSGRPFKRAANEERDGAPNAKG